MYTDEWKLWCYNSSKNIINKLCLNFKLKCPEIFISDNDEQRAFFTKVNKNYSIIVIYKNAWGSTDCLLHEFAHYLHFKQNPKLYYKREEHGKFYYTYLKQTISYWYKHPMNYDWQWEYEKLINIAKKDKFVDRNFKKVIKLEK